MSQTESVNWDQLIEWDKKYYLQEGATLQERAPFPIVKAEGMYLYDNKGNKILDFASGIYCANIGHQNPVVKQYVKQALDEFGYLFEVCLTKYRAQASKMIIEDILGRDEWAGKIRFQVSGSEAVEEALLFARLFTNKYEIVTRRHAYHGWTGHAGQCTRLRRARAMLASPTDPNWVRDVPGWAHHPGFLVATPPICYRCPLGYPDPSECKKPFNGKLACVAETEWLIKNVGPENVAAIITEIMMGVGMAIPPADYIPQIRKMTKELKILWIDDEVIGGFGRTGKWFAYQNYTDVVPDIMTVAKGIVNAAIPASGCIISKEIADFFDQYRWYHIGTFHAHPIAMAAIVGNLRYMLDTKIVDHAAQMSRYLSEALKGLEDRHKSVGLAAGMGLYQGIELVKNKATREPFIKEDRDATAAGDYSNWPGVIVFFKCLEKGMWLPFFAPQTLRLSPSLIVNEEEINKAIEILDYAISEIDKKCD